LSAMKPTAGDSLFWLISVPNNARERDESAVQAAQQKRLQSDARAHKFGVNRDLRVGTMDALMSLSDDLAKVDIFVEGVVRKLARQIYELDADAAAAGRPVLTVNSAQPEHFLTHFQWDEAKYPSKSTLRDLTKQISEECSKLEEEYRGKLGEYQQTLTTLSALDRRDTGNLLVRNLADIVTEKHITYTEHITTLLVVLPKYQLSEWQQCYESLCQFVVPRSSDVIREDVDLVLVNIKLFRNFTDEVKAKCRERRWTVRDFQFDPTTVATQDAEKQRLTENRQVQGQKLMIWCKSMFTEAFQAWIHLKCMRLFVESVLRYGLPLNFSATLIHLEKKSNEKRVREVLEQMYKGLVGARVMSGDAKDEKEDDEYYPYVFFALNLDMKPQQTN